MTGSPYRLAFALMGLPALLGARFFLGPFLSMERVGYSWGRFLQALWTPEVMLLVALYFAFVCIFQGKIIADMKDVNSNPKEKM